ncbi:hypothetical protein EVAR_83057_1 [Eumeta japonica]|uniref:Uncharacterized protein n=1 Tax=Eumeta variegata TaxID=151549 RepID=A0A4C1VN20_EUMVA|nr:hypothetical protein EVAR_83057_1 [Eumeta japonica]
MKTIPFSSIVLTEDDKQFATLKFATVLSVVNPLSHAPRVTQSRMMLPVRMYLDDATYRIRLRIAENDRGLVEPAVHFDAAMPRSGVRAPKCPTVTNSSPMIAVYCSNILPCCVRPLSLFYSDASADGAEERSLVPRSRSPARLRRNATMSHAFSCVQPSLIDL